MADEPQASRPGATARGEVEAVEPTKLERAVARGVAESKATIPHIYAEAEADLSDWVAAGGSTDGSAHRDLTVWAAGRALRDCPRLNGAYRDGRFELYSRVNVGIAVPAKEGVLVATVHDADGLSPAEIGAAARELEARADAGEITQPELSGGTFTVIWPGPGLTAFTPVVQRGQAAALGVGDVTAQAVIRDGAVATGHALRLVLACDHRIVTARHAAEFLGRVTSLLAEAPTEGL